MENGFDLNLKSFEKDGFGKPILIQSSDGLDFKMPKANEMDLNKIENIVGASYQVEVIDVELRETTQNKMKLSDPNSYFKQNQREKIFNVLNQTIS